MNKTQRNTIKRLEALKKLATKFNSSKSSDDKDTIKIGEQLNTTHTLSKVQNYCVVHTKAMQMFVLDIRDLVNNERKFSPSVYWQTPIAPHFFQAPTDTILYTLAKGQDEIVMFGGMELMDSPLFHVKPSYDQMKHRVSNKLYVMKPASLFVSTSSQQTSVKSLK
jgi:hypothetical protein